MKFQARPRTTTPSRGRCTQSRSAGRSGPINRSAGTWVVCAVLRGRERGREGSQASPAGSRMAKAPASPAVQARRQGRSGARRSGASDATIHRSRRGGVPRRRKHARRDGGEARPTSGRPCVAVQLRRHPTRSTMPTSQPAKEAEQWRGRTRTNGASPNFSWSAQRLACAGSATESIVIPVAQSMAKNHERTPAAHPATTRVAAAAASKPGPCHLTARSLTARNASAVQDERSMGSLSETAEVPCGLVSFSRVMFLSTTTMPRKRNPVEVLTDEPPDRRTR